MEAEDLTPMEVEEARNLGRRYIIREGGDTVRSSKAGLSLYSENVKLFHGKPLELAKGFRVGEANMYRRQE